MEDTLSALSPASKLLVSTNWQELMHVLKEKAIPVRTPEELLQLRTESERVKTENESISRWNHAIAWVIGTPESKEASGPQAWFEKDTFLPLRLVYGSEGAGVLDFHFESYHFFHEFPYPRNYSVSKKGKGTVLQAQLIDLSLISDTKSTSSNRKEAGFTPVGELAPSALKDLVQFYYASVR